MLVGNVTPPGVYPPFKIRFGIEVKRALDLMESLPPPAAIIANPRVRSAFHTLRFQAESQAKAAIKNQLSHTNTVSWILVVGPYWRHVKFGPFTPSGLSVRALKSSSSADFLATSLESDRVDKQAPPLTTLFLLCEDESFQRLEGILRATDTRAKILSDAYKDTVR